MASLSQGKPVIREHTPAEVFVEGTKEKIEEEVKRCVDTAARNNPFILATAARYLIMLPQKI
ncbi:hypothetical protein ACFLVA_01315 [Chloroflexota bacterium]